MAVKTTFSKEDFDEILPHCNLGQYERLKPFKLGAIPTNILLKTTKGKFVFRYYESRPKSYALFEVAVLQYLTENSSPAPAPNRNILGHFVGEYKENALWSR